MDQLPRRTFRFTQRPLLFLRSETSNDKASEARDAVRCGTTMGLHVHTCLRTNETQVFAQVSAVALCAAWLPVIEYGQIRRAARPATLSIPPSAGASRAEVPALRLVLLEVAHFQDEETVTLPG